MKMIGKKRNKKKPKPESSFLVKLYTILDGNKYSKYIKWSQDGLSIIILNQNAFTKNVLPDFFNHHNYSSFVRQLNLYNFHKIKSNKKGEQKYMHDQFHQSKTLEEIQLIKKKVKLDEDFIIPSKTKHLFNEKLGENNLNEDKKEYIEKIEKLDEETKIKNFLNILKNGKLSNISNEIILNYLLDKSKESIEKEKKVETEINTLIAQNNYLFEQLNEANNKLLIENNNSKKMKGMILYLMKRLYNIKNKENNKEKKFIGDVNEDEKNKKFVELINKYRKYKIQEQIINNLNSSKTLIIDKNAKLEINSDFFYDTNFRPNFFENEYNTNVRASNIFNSNIYGGLNSLRNSRIYNSKYNLFNSIYSVSNWK